MGVEEALNDRAVVTVAVGKDRYREQAVALARSLRLIGDLTHRVLVTDQAEADCHDVFDEIVTPPASVSPYLLKLEVPALVSRRRILFLDSDSLVFRRLDRIFALSEGASVAARGRWISDGEWYGELDENLPKIGLDRIPMINGGMIYFDRELCGPVIEEAHRVAADYDSTGLNKFRGKVPDEPCIAIAMARAEGTRLLSDDLDTMNTGTGLIGRMKLRTDLNQCRYLQRTWKLRYKTPDVFHAADYVKFYPYWREIRRLEGFERNPGTDAPRFAKFDRWWCRMRYGRRW
ncbi:hypothetical protein EON81_13835 [bacterium]|nr:MAG: hypothetical protein EON81_13835 [bacterium]